MDSSNDYGDDGDDYDYDMDDEEYEDNEDLEEYLDEEEDMGDEEEYFPEDTNYIIPDKEQKKSYEVDFKVHSIDDILSIQRQEISHISGILSCSLENSAILLRLFKWSKERLIEEYMENLDFSKQYGVELDVNKLPKLIKIKNFECPVCCEDSEDIDTLALACNHRFCKNCYESYFIEKIKDQGESRRIQCMNGGCKLLVDQKTIENVVSPDILKKYNELLIRTYVDDLPHLKWCPAPDCGYAIECNISENQLLKIVPIVTCNCGHTFCFGCGNDNHQPCICALAKLWFKKCDDDSETSNWLSANTKECTKCQSTIEKNGGCNHMTCKKCKNEFCWVCLGPWAEHGTQWYTCNRFDEPTSIDARDSQAKSRRDLERYLHYFNRYNNHEQSARLSSALMEKVLTKMDELQKSSSLSWIEVQFLKKAVEVLLQSRRTLKWTYALAYYMIKDNAAELFDDNQRDLEIAVESLSELLEKPVTKQDADGIAAGAALYSSSSNGKSNDDGKKRKSDGRRKSSKAALSPIQQNETHIKELRQSILDKMGYVQKRREVLLRDTALGMKENRWKYNVDLFTGAPIE